MHNALYDVLADVDDFNLGEKTEREGEEEEGEGEEKGRGKNVTKIIMKMDHRTQAWVM